MTQSSPVLFRFLLGACALLFAAFAFTNVSQAAKYASLIMDATTGQVYHARYADHKRHPASLTKIMTLYMVFDALERGTLRLDQRLAVSRRAEGMAPSKLGLKRGQTIKVRDAILALITKSANDVAVVVAEALGGTEIEFARMMTERARRIGMSNTSFRNASGLYNKRQKSTARDMAQLALRIRSDFPQYYDLFSRQKFSYGGKTYKNHNNLLAQYAGSDGIKTGYIGAAGFNLVASVERNGRRLIGVVFGGRSAKSRDKHMISLFDKAFASSGAYFVRAPRPKDTPKFAAQSGGQVAQLNAASSIRAPVSESLTRTIVAQASNGGSNPFTPLQKTGDQSSSRLSATFLAQVNRALAAAATQRPAASYSQSGTRSSGTVTSTNRLPSLSQEAIAALSVVAKQAQQPQTVLVSGNQLESEQGLKQGSEREETWMIQVGAFGSKERATRAANLAQDALGALGDSAEIILAPTSGRKTLYRSRLAGLTKEEAYSACKELKSARMECVPFAPRVERQVANRR